MRHVMWAVVILSSLAVAGSAQIRRGAFPRSEAPSQEERAIARALIDDALREASGLKAAENLLVIRAAAASLLQDEDPHAPPPILPALRKRSRR